MNRLIIAAPIALGLISGIGLQEASKKDEHHQIHRRPAIHTTYQPASLTLLPGQEDTLREHCPFGLPKSTTDLHGPTMVVVHDGYVAEQSTLDKVPLWVAETIKPENLTGSEERSDNFRGDPLVPDHLEAHDDDYVRTGYDRGHLAPAGNQTTDEDRKDETFYFTNMAPQLPRFNRHRWSRLERKLRDWAEDGGDVYTITGPIYHDPTEEGPGADGLVEHFAIGRGGVSVPTHFFKIAVQRQGNGYRAIAFAMPNRNDVSRDISRYRKSIRWIEQRTGYDFFPGDTDRGLAPLPADLKTAPSPMW